jgi:DNA-binding NtrC family response regulator
VCERPRIAVVDDEEIVCREIARGLSREPYTVETFTDAEAALGRLEQVGFELVLCDLRMPRMDGMALLQAVRGLGTETEVIIITAHSSIDSAIEAIRAGAFHYLTKPVKQAELRLLIRRALDRVTLVREREALREELAASTRPGGMIGGSRPMLDVFRMIDKVAPLDCNVLIQGESGTGKEMVARALHRGGPRREGPFVSFNCGGFTEELITNELFGHERGAFTGATTTKKGLLEAAHGGSILLDEVEEMPMSMQVKLLRFIEERSLMRVGGVTPIPVDVRLIAAGNQDLTEMVRQGRLREDLYYRLKVVVVELPPLRERSGDLPLLIDHQVRKYNRAFGKERTGITPEALRLLSRYAFPGNVRELENAVARAVALSEDDLIGVDDLPPEILIAVGEGGPGRRWPTLDEHEAGYIREVLRHTGKVMRNYAAGNHPCAFR